MTEPVVYSQTASISENSVGGSTARNQTIDIIKGIGIILMVWGHISGSAFHNFIYLFHMPILFTCSGYCWNDKHIKSRTSAKKYLLKKIKSLYVPFVIFNIAMLLLNNAFVLLRLLPEKSALSLKDNLMEIVKVPLLMGGIPLFGNPTWFLRTLFLILVGHLCLEYIASRIHFGLLLRVLVVFACIIVAQCLNDSQGVLKQISTLFTGYIAYFMGVLWKRLAVIFPKSKSKNFLIFAGCFAALCGCSKIGSIDISRGHLTNIVFYMIAISLGWLMMYSIAQIFSGKLARGMAYIGQRTLGIVFWHLLFFKLVSAVYIFIFKYDLSLLSEYPAIQQTDGFLWIAYLLSGVCMPLLIRLLISKIKTATNDKISM